MELPVIADSPDAAFWDVAGEWPATEKLGIAEERPQVKFLFARHPDADRKERSVRSALQVADSPQAKASPSPSAKEPEAVAYQTKFPQMRSNESEVLTYPTP